MRLQALTCLSVPSPGRAGTKTQLQRDTVSTLIMDNRDDPAARMDNR